MIPLLLSSLLGAGLWLVYEGCTNPQAPQVQVARLRRLARLRVVEELLVQAGLPDVSPRDFALFSIGAALAGGLVTHLLLGWPLFSVLAAGAGLVAPALYYVRRRDRRRAALEGALVVAAEQLRDAIRSGLSVEAAVAGLAGSGPDALRPELRRLAREQRLIGFEPAITSLQARLADPVFDAVAVCLRLNDRLGGRNLSQVLDRLAHATRAQRRSRQDLHAHQARHVTAARVVAALPLVVLVAVRQVNPSYAAVFGTAWGQLVLVGCVLSVVVGYLTMVAIGRLPSEPRVLAGGEA